MIVYIEWVILDNLALDMLLAYLTRRLLRQRATLWRLVFSAVVGTALVFPFLYIEPTWARLLYKVAVLLAVCLPLSDSVKLLRKNLVVYAALSAAFGGLYYLITDTSLTLSYGVVHTSGGVVAVLSASILSGLYLLRQLKGIVVDLRRRHHLVKVQIVNGDRYVFVKGFYDTGNTVVAPNGKGVVFLSPKIRDSLGRLSHPENIEVRTISGQNSFEVYRIDCVKIYSEGQVNTIKGVNVAYSKDNLSGCDALLSYNL